MGEGDVEGQVKSIVMIMSKIITRCCQLWTRSSRAGGQAQTKSGAVSQGHSPNCPCSFGTLLKGQKKPFSALNLFFCAVSLQDIHTMFIPALVAGNFRGKICSIIIYNWLAYVLKVEY